MSKSIIITGASTGIGKALAYELAERGYSIGLTARRLELLQEIKKDIEDKYSSSNPLVEVAALDVCEEERIFEVISQLSKELGGLDIIIINAAVTGVNRTGKGDFNVDKNIIQTNLIGAMATVDAAATIFRDAGQGHIVGISSIAAYSPIPGSAAYSASKAGFSCYLKAVRSELKNKNITVTTLHPGFIKTDMTLGIKNTPFMITAETCATIMADLIEKKVASSTVPVFPWGALTTLLKVAPDSIMSKLW